MNVTPMDRRPKMRYGQAPDGIWTIWLSPSTETLARFDDEDEGRKVAYLAAKLLGLPVIWEVDA